MPASSAVLAQEESEYSSILWVLLIVINNITILQILYRYLMKSSTVKLSWILVVVAAILPTVNLDQQGVNAQDSPNMTNATVLSGDDAKIIFTR